MKLESFRIQNYKKIEDTGWVSCRDLTAFVGKNEAGKSAIFRGLSKLNPSDGEKYDSLKEFPRKRYTDEFSRKDWEVSTGRFVLKEDEKKSLYKSCSALEGVEKVEVTRYYSWKTNVTFIPELQVTLPVCLELQEHIDNSVQQIQGLTAPEGKGDTLGTLKQSLLEKLQQHKTTIKDNAALTKVQVENTISIVSAHANEDWQKTLLDPLLERFRLLMTRIDTWEKLETAKKWVIDNLPRFIYFDNYDVIDSAVYIPTFIQQLASNQGGPRIRTTNCLFKHVGLDAKQISGLGRHQPDQGDNKNTRRQIDERAVLASSASIAMTEKFSDWWEQRKHKFTYQFDGDYFRIWVSDDIDPSEIELDQRSMGMQYFFSFYTVFLVETNGEHTNSILLLDEPGLHLHGTAQLRIIKFFEKLSKDNQTLYTTHSPFMVDSDHLENTRAVYESEDGNTKVSEDVWPRDKDSLFPLQAALGYQLAQSLFISKRQIIVEGLTDLWILKAADQALASMDKQHLRSDVVIVPSAGISKLLPLASMLIGNDVDVVALLDGDEPARKEGKKLIDNLLNGQERRCLFIGDFVTNKNAEIEDVFTEDEYLSAFGESYPNIDLDFSDTEKSLGIIDRIEAIFERKGLGKYEKWRVASVLRDRLVDSPDKVSQLFYDVIGQIFQNANNLWQ